MKHLPVWSFIYLCVVFLYSVGPSVSFNTPLETKHKFLNLIIGCDKFYLYAFIPPLSHYFLKETCVVLIDLGGLISLPKSARILVKFFRDFNVFCLLLYKTSMSSVFTFTRLQCLLSFTFQDFNVFSVYFVLGQSIVIWPSDFE